MKDKLTGKTRHRIENRLFRKPLVVLQHEVEGFVPEWNAGIIEGEFRTWWVDSRPEWIMENNHAQ